MVANILTCLVLSFAVMVRRRAFFQEMCLTIETFHKIHEAILRDGGSVGLPDARSFMESLSPHTPAHVPGTAPGPHYSVGPGGIGKP